MSASDRVKLVFIGLHEVVDRSKVADHWAVGVVEDAVGGYNLVVLDGDVAPAKIDAGLVPQIAHAEVHGSSLLGAPPVVDLL